MSPAGGFSPAPGMSLSSPMNFPGASTAVSGPRSPLASVDSSVIQSTPLVCRPVRDDSWIQCHHPHVYPYYSFAMEDVPLCCSAPRLSLAERRAGDRKLVFGSIYNLVEHLREYRVVVSAIKSLALFRSRTSQRELGIFPGSHQGVPQPCSCRHSRG